MPDREKLIKFLAEIAEYFAECRGNASFGSKAEEHFWELMNAAREAADILKPQKPRVMPFEEVQQADAGTVVWFEQHTPELDYMNPMVSTGDGCVGNNFLGVCLQYITNEARGFRFWTSRPTDEQRKSTPWEPPKEEL